MSENVDAIGYLVVEGIRYRYGDKPVRGAKIARVTRNKPSTLSADQVAVRVTVRIPAAAFEPLQPAALVIVPEELVQHPVEAEAVPE